MTQSMCQRFKVRVIIGIVLVGLKKRYNTWRCCIHKNLFCTVFLCGIFHTLNVIVKRALIFHCNWAHTTRSSVRGCTTTARCAIHKPRIFKQVSWRSSGAVTIKACISVFDVRCITYLAHLTIGDDINSGHNLTPHDLINCLCHHLVKDCFVHRFAAL